jgi:sulfite exporter TauE/SafE
MGAFGVGTSLGLTALGIVLNAFKLAGLPRRASGMILMAFALWMVWPLGSTHSKASTPDRTSHPSVHDYRADTHSGDGRDVGHRHAID